MKKFKPLQPAPWARAEERRRLRQEMSTEFFLKVRFIFVVLLLATILVYAHNHYVEIQQLTSEKFNQLAKKATVQDQIRAKAMSHENEVNQAGQSSQTTQSNQTAAP